MTAESIQWQQRQIRIQGKGRPLRQKDQGAHCPHVAPGASAPGTVVRPQRPFPGRPEGVHSHIPGQAVKVEGNRVEVT